MRGIIIIASILFGHLMVAQDILNISDSTVVNNYEKILDDYAIKRPGLKEKIKIDISGLTIEDVINVLAQEHELNVSADIDFIEPINTNFFDVTVKDVYLFLIDKYNLDFRRNRDILVFTNKKEIIEKEIIEEKAVDLSFDPRNKFLSIKIRNDSLIRVAAAITDATGENIILSPDLKGKIISSYIINRPIEDVLSLMAKGNNLSLDKDLNGTYFLSLLDENSKEQSEISQDNNNSTNSTSNFEVLGENYISLNENGFISINVKDMPLKQIIESAAIKSNVNYLLYDQLPIENRTVKVELISFDDLLKHLFAGRENGFTYEDGLYLIGNEKTEGIRKSKLIKMKNRTIENVLISLPKIFTDDLEIKEFIELNGLIVTGNPILIKELEDYLLQIDEVVPLIDIQVIIVQYQKGYDFTSGLTIGKDDQPRSNTGVLNPGVNGTLNQSGINRLIDVFNGWGVFNIGQVTDNFYVNLELLETNSVIKIHSTPRIATLSGHQATLSIGQTDYYFEQNNRILTGNVNTDVLNSGTWKPTDANLRVSILPYVSTDESITLQITVDQDSFTGRVADTAPPGKSTQNFESLVRVKNNEMILLGGLDEINNENSGSGTPLLSRIPVLKWFFSKRRKAKNTSKLHIFIKPVITY
ncbi:MAG: type II and III secretion system protein [Nonlabens sp.]|uniref:type II secretion system protein GspD n=1 Tax=Nonlabens sp. TaxID=1888209 RepID=UPI00321AC8CB